MVPHVLAGAITVTGTHPTNGTRGTASGTLLAAGSLDLSVSLQATGTLRGRVLAPDGVTAVAGASVATGYGTATTGADGRFEFADAALGSYTLSATVAGRLRARATVTLDTNGQVVDRDLVLVGAAAVSGRVTDAGSQPVAGASISLYSLAAIYGGVFGATTDATGHYLIADVPLGAFNVTGSRGADRASASGTVATDGVGVTVDLTLLPSAVTLPIGLTDGNGFSWQVARDGTVSQGVMFKGPENGARLAVVRDAVATAFAGPACTPTCTAATEEGQREIVLPEAAVAGLEVTRKVYVRQGRLLRAPARRGQEPRPRPGHDRPELHLASRGIVAPGHVLGRCGLRRRRPLDHASTMATPPTPTRPRSAPTAASGRSASSPRARAASRLRP